MPPREEQEKGIEDQDNFEEKEEDILEEKSKSEEIEPEEEELIEEEEEELDEEEELAKRQFLYRGHTIDELKRMNMDEFIQLIPARQRRSLKRGLPNRHKKLLDRLRRAYRAKKKGKDLVVRTHCRDMIIFPEMVGLSVGVYNGNQFVTYEIKPDMIGGFLGEFSIPTVHVSHGSPGIGATRSSKFVPLK
jgi:small subunit ribosomal protein S19